MVIKMDQRILTLRDWGCDIASAMARMLDDEAFYLECLNDIPTDKNFDQLVEALQQKDVQTAFDCAHTLKGVLANLGLTPMYKKVVEIVEPLRRGNGDGLLEQVAELMELKNHLSAILHGS